MFITFFDKMKTLIKVYEQLIKFKLPMKQTLFHLLNPIDATRYVEFTYLLNFIKNNNLSKMNILDVSSPHMMSYILSSQNKVIKTDISPVEKRNIKENQNLSFRLEDATMLSFIDEYFDFVYSISVVEHIYQKYTQAIKEMIRVCKSGGYIYLSFPCSANHLEEWVNYDIYTHQYKEGNKTFFQYRFSEDDIKKIFEQLENVEVVNLAIYWETNNGQYDMVISQLKKQLINKYITYIKNSFINFWAGFTLLENNPSDFTHPKVFGNMSVILRKVS